MFCETTGIPTFVSILNQTNFEDLPLPDPAILKELLQAKMPFGKYKDTLIKNLPVSYLEWFGRKGFPKGKLGMQLQTMLEIKSNGLMDLLDGFK